MQQISWWRKTERKHTKTVSNCGLCSVAYTKRKVALCHGFPFCQTSPQDLLKSLWKFIDIYQSTPPLCETLIVFVFFNSAAANLITFENFFCLHRPAENSVNY